MKKRILIPYFLAGSGHLVSATAIHHYLCLKKPEWEIRLFEPAEELRIDRLNRLYKRSWHFVLRRPVLSRFLFFLAAHPFSFLTLAVNRQVTRRSAPAMKQFLAEYRPDLIITTHWGCGHLAAEAMKTGAPVVPLFVVRNDLGGAYKLQNVSSDLTILMAREAIDAFLRLGVPESRLMQVNLLVRPQFSGDSDHSEGAEGCDGIFKILLSSGGEGFGKIEEAARTMLTEADRSNHPVSIDILAGRNEELKAQLEHAVTDKRVTIHGYREDIHVLMRQADVVVGKCGANYTMETVMMRKPFLITQVGAASERPNMRFVLDRGYGWHAGNTLSLRNTLARIFSDPQELLSKLDNLQKLPRTNGAAEIADRVIAGVEQGMAVLDRPIL